MLGRDDDYVSGLQRAHHGYRDAGNLLPAVRCACWIGHSLLFRGEELQASGWFGRAQRLLETTEPDCVERGYLLIPLWLRQMASGDNAAGYRTAVAATEIGERFGDADLMRLARDEQGPALVNLGRWRRACDSDEFLWQYLSSTPLPDALRNLDDQARDVLRRQVVAEWEPLTEEGALILELDG